MPTPTHDHEPSGHETALTLLGSAIALALLIAIGNAVPDVLVGAFTR